MLEEERLETQPKFEAQQKQWKRFESHLRTELKQAEIYTKEWESKINELKKPKGKLEIESRNEINKKTKNKDYK